MTAEQPGETQVTTGAATAIEPGAELMDVRAEFEAVAAAWREHVPPQTGTAQDLVDELDVTLGTLQRAFTAAVAPPTPRKPPSTSVQAGTATGKPAEPAAADQRTDAVPDHCIAAWPLPRLPESAAAARTAVEQQLAHWRLDDLVWVADQVVSELVGNAVRHAVGIGVSAADDDPGEIILRMLKTAGELIIEVHDGSKAAPHVRHPSYEAEYGRGLVILGILADSWGARHAEPHDPTDPGSVPSKCVWAAFPLPDHQ